MEEFYLSHHKVMKANPNYLIPVLMEDLNIDQLPRDLQTYLRTHTYIDAREFDLETLRKRIRFSMPDVPLAELRRKQRKNEGLEMDVVNEQVHVINLSTAIVILHCRIL